MLARPLNPLPGLAVLLARHVRLGACAPMFLIVWSCVGGLLADEPAEQVIYTALRPAHWDLFLMEEPGSKPQRLTNDPALDYNPAISPDGRWLVFCSERGGDPNLYVIDLDRRGTARRLVTGRGMVDAPAFAPRGDRLIFVSTRDGNADLFTLEFSPGETINVSKAMNLTSHPGGDFNPAVSPDGRQIVFSSDREGYKASDIFVMQADGSRVKRLTDSPGWDGSPAWSSDGKTLFFYSERDGKPRIYQMDSDGEHQRPLTPAGQPALSPTVLSGGRIAYSVQQDGQWVIESRQLDGSEPRLESDQSTDYWAPASGRNGRPLVCHGVHPVEDPRQFNSSTPGPFLVHETPRVSLPDRNVALRAIRGYFPSWNANTGFVASDEGFNGIVVSRPDGSDRRLAFEPRPGSKAWRPSWSPDGNWLACSVGQTFAKPGTNVAIWKFRPDGSQQVNLTADRVHNDAFPDFSPDGTRIVFRSGRDGNHEIYLMDADGNNPRRLTDHPAVDTMPTFSAKNDQVAFTSNRGGDYEIYLLDLTEGGAPGRLRRLTDSPGRDTHPKFSPDGTWMVFASERGGMNDESPLIPVFNPQPYGEIVVQRISDGHLLRLTHNKWEDGTPTWGQCQVQ